jgi:hypothetical protein
VVAVERPPQGRAAEARGAERDLLPGLGRIRVLGAVRGDQMGNVDVFGIGCWLTCAVMLPY